MSQKGYDDAAAKNFNDNMTHKIQDIQIPDSTLSPNFVGSSMKGQQSSDALNTNDMEKSAVEKVSDGPASNASAESAVHRTWRCSLCRETFSQKSHMKLHSKCHEGRRKYLCSRCPKQFKNPEACNVHYNSHFMVKCHTCLRCFKRFAKKGNLLKHKKMHDEVAQGSYGTWTCTHCNKRFVKKANWAHHRLMQPCVERQRVSERLRESCRRLAHIVNSMKESPCLSTSRRSFQANDNGILNALGSPPPSPTKRFLLPASVYEASSDSDGSIEDNNNSSSEAEHSAESADCEVTSTTKD